MTIKLVASSVLLPFLALGCAPQSAPVDTIVPTPEPVATATPMPAFTPQPTSDIEATVTARVQATIAAIPTATPVPPTPTPIPQPTPEPTATLLSEPTVTASPTRIPAGPAPLVVTFSEMSKNSIGVPVLVVKVENISEKVIDGYEIAIAPLNRFGESIERFETGDRSIKGVSNSIIEPKITANSNPKAAPVYCGSTKEECGGYSNVICSVTSAGRSCRGIPPERVYCGDFEWDSKCPEYSNVSCNVGGTPRCTGIPPLKVYFQSITLHGYNTATNAELKLIRVHFQDETSWRNPDIIDPLSEIAIDTN